MSNGIASAGSIFWSAVLQVITVPVLLNYWGAERYGVWLMLSALPVYMALSDLGLGSAATSDMTMAYANGDIGQVNCTFHSVLKLTTLISAGLLLLTCAVLGTLSVMPIDLGFWVDHYDTIVVLIAYACCSIFSRIILAGYRSTRQYAFGTLLYDALQFLEGLSVLILAASGYSYLAGALGLLTGRLLLTGVMVQQIKKRVPVLKVGFSQANTSEIRRILHPALGALSIPAALAINTQGMVLVAGAMVSPVAAAMLSPTRTISRIAIQLVGIINRATIPEFSAACAKGDLPVIRKLIRANAMVMALVLLPGAILFGVFGRQLVELWSKQQISPPLSFVALMALSMFVHGCWYFSSNLLLALNRHTAVAATLLMGAVAAVILAYAVAPTFGLMGVGVSILIAELIAAIRVIVVVLQVKKSLSIRNSLK
jgi:O-antigen/teichoic acid export membrane protein